MFTKDTSRIDELLPDGYGAKNALDDMNEVLENGTEEEKRLIVHVIRVFFCEPLHIKADEVIRRHRNRLNALIS